MIHELFQYLRKIPIKQWPNGDENRTQPGKHNPQQNKSSYTAGKKAGMMRLICKIKEINRRGISNHDTCFEYDPTTIMDVADHLVWPWKAAKTHPFTSSFSYLGFLWDLEHHSVEIPPVNMRGSS